MLEYVDRANNDIANVYQEVQSAAKAGKTIDSKDISKIASVIEERRQVEENKMKETIERDVAAQRELDEKAKPAQGVRQASPQKNVASPDGNC